MATVKEEFELLKAKILSGKGNQVIHVIDHAQERRRKIDNPQGSTRVILNCRTPEAYAEFQKEKERFFEIAVDPHVAISLLTKALRLTSDEVIRAWVKIGHEEPGDEIPGWMKG